MRIDLITRSPKIPLAIKLVYSVFLAWHLFLHLRFYGPINYLWFCDISLLTTAAGLWVESSLLLSMTAISFLGPATLWMADFFFKLLMHRDWLGWTDYMQDANLPLQLRVASTFHIWLPILLLWCIHRVGYYRRALLWQTLFAIAVVILSRTLGDPPPAHDLHHVVNINCAYGNSDHASQTKLPAPLYLAKLIIKCWVGMYLPLHLMMSFAFNRKPRWTAEESTPNAFSAPV
jgi:hypothetical protein